jgi:hypothetical protein
MSVRPVISRGDRTSVTGHCISRKDRTSETRASPERIVQVRPEQLQKGQDKCDQSISRKDRMTEE